jgi:hypothetical protein
MLHERGGHIGFGRWVLRYKDDTPVPWWWNADGSGAAAVYNGVVGLTPLGQHIGPSASAAWVSLAGVMPAMVIKMAAAGVAGPLAYYCPIEAGGLALLALGEHVFRSFLYVVSACSMSLEEMQKEGKAFPAPYNHSVTIHAGHDFASFAQDTSMELQKKGICSSAEGRCDPRHIAKSTATIFFLSVPIVLTMGVLKSLSHRELIVAGKYNKDEKDPLELVREWNEALVPDTVQSVLQVAPGGSHSSPRAGSSNSSPQISRPTQSARRSD